MSAFAPPSGADETSREQQDERPEDTFMQRILTAHRNMQANVPLRGIRITMHMDFYTALLRTGFSVMTMASEAVYLNESRGVNIGKHTWLEEERLRELETTAAQLLGPTFRAYDPSHFNDGLADNVGLVAAKDQPMDLLHQSSSGYAKEMTAQKVQKHKGPHDRLVRDGVGAAERSGRWILALEFFLAINRIFLSLWASLALRLLLKMGIQARPRLLVWLVSHLKNGTFLPNFEEYIFENNN